MHSKTRVLILQLPLNPSAPLEATGNVPLAGAVLAAASSLPPECIIDQLTADTLGDRALLEMIVRRSPELAAFTLYMWNVERSVWLANEVKKELPGILTVAGGPEVTEDNEWLLAAGAFDLLVSGEGEEFAEQVMSPDSVKDIISGTGSFLNTGRMSFPPGTYPNPWLTGYLDPSDGASVYVETIRGCPGRCTYCSYRRTHPSPRTLDALNSELLLRKLTSAGAGEIVFLDPTFNSRSDLDILLGGMKMLDVEFFGEMQGDLISPEMASDIANAGFNNVEIGLQSVNTDTLMKCGRPGSPDSVLDGALHLKRAGVSPIIDIMLGLPGDRPQDAVKAALMIKDRGLHQHVQAFYLSILPGTMMKNDNMIGQMPLPPYYRFGDAGMGGFAGAREEISDLLGYDLDLPGRPLLFEDWSGTEYIDLSTDPDLQRQMPSFRHGALRITSENFWIDRNRLLEFARTRFEADPFCVLDLILCPVQEFPLDLLDMIKELDQPIDYSGRTARVLGRQGNLRVCILLKRADGFRRSWIMSAAAACTVVIDAGSPSELPDDLLEAGVSVRLPGCHWDLSSLSAEVPSLQQLFFMSRLMEENWSRIQDI